MRLPITDKFLWDVVNAMSSTEDALRWLIHPPRTMRHVALMVDDPIYQKYYKVLHPQYFSQLIYRLKKNGHIKIENLKNKQAIILTKRGISKAFRGSFKMGDRQKRKDGKWIMIIFDIPQKRWKARNLLRDVLQNLGYKMFQQSVWVTPYDVSEKTETALQYYSLDNYVKIFLIERF